MPKNTSKKVPWGANVITTYAGLAREMDAFAHCERNLLIVVGPPGTAKSTAGRQYLGDARIIEGGATPYRLYMELYKHRDLPVVLDDADKVFRNRDGVFLLKLLTQTDGVKTIQWNSNALEIRMGELPAEFATTSRVLVIANSWPQEDPDTASIESRGHLHYFAPTFAEVHAHAGTFFKDEEIYSFVGGNLDLFERLDLRLYGKAAEVKATGLRTGDPVLWKEFIQGHFVSGPRRKALELMRDQSFRSDNERAARFKAESGMSPRAFYRLRDEMRALRDGAVANS